MKKYLMNNRGKAEDYLIFAFIPVIMVLIYSILLSVIYNESNLDALDSKKCKQIRITDPQTEETIELYGTNIQTNRYVTEIQYTDKNGKEHTQNISQQENSILEIEVVDKEFCK